MQPVSRQTRQTRTAAGQQQTRTDSKAPHEGGLTISLWLVAALAAEAELFLWLLERAYSS